MKMHLEDIAKIHGPTFIARIADYDSFDEDFNAKVRVGVRLYESSQCFMSPDLECGGQFAKQCWPGVIAWEYVGPWNPALD